ncbi:MAG: serine protease [bacterium]|nr:serine protease [bacterium]
MFSLRLAFTILLLLAAIGQLVMLILLPRPGSTEESFRQKNDSTPEPIMISDEAPPGAVEDESYSNKSEPLPPLSSEVPESGYPNGASQIEMSLPAASEAAFALSQESIDMPATGEPSDSYKAIVALMVRGERVGTGFIVRHTPTGIDLVTAQHVTDDMEDVVLRLWLGSGTTSNYRDYATFEVIYADYTRDLSYVRVVHQFGEGEGGVQAALRVASNPPEKKEFFAWAVDAGDVAEKPRMLGVNVVDRIRAKRFKTTDPIHYWKLEQDSAPGMSGGPLLDQQGNVIGVASGNSRGHGYYCAHREIVTFLQEARLHDGTRKISLR